jgi:uncharacterized protein
MHERTGNVSCPKAQAEVDRKYRGLTDILRTMQRVVVAFSGGVDSTLLLCAARDCLPRRDVLAVTAVSPVLPRREQADAVALAGQLGVRHELWQSTEMDDPGFRRNPKDKCYRCKRARFAHLVGLARERGYAWVADGENVDDADDFRPGSRAARELGVRSPLKEAGLTKDDIRRLSRRLGLQTWDKPASACLASRIPYHQPITAEKLAQVEAGEDFVRGLGVCRQVRVRHHGDVARIEVPAEAVRLLTAGDLGPKIVERFKSLGFLHVAVDLEGYRTGSLNRALADEPQEGHRDGHRVP